MDGSPMVDCFVVNGKGSFCQWKNDFSSMADGVFVLESSTVDGVFADEWLVNGCFVVGGKGSFCQRKNDFLLTADGVFILELCVDWNWSVCCSNS